MCGVCVCSGVCACVCMCAYVCKCVRARICVCVCVCVCVYDLVYFKCFSRVWRVFLGVKYTHLRIGKAFILETKRDLSNFDS